MTITKEKLSKYSSKTGIYIMKNDSGDVLYVGKAKNIKARLKQYFITNRDTRAMVGILIRQVKNIETIVVTNEKEALILENTLIKKFRPKYNVLLKDDKTYASLMLTNHKWPKLTVVRKRNFDTKTSKKDKNKYFGPYTNAAAAKNILDLLLSLFPLRGCSDNEFLNRKKPCILFEIKKCLAPCMDLCSEETYQNYVLQIEQILSGKNKKLIAELKRKMQIASKKLEFEEAQKYLHLIKQLKHVLQNQFVENLSTKDMDVFNFIIVRETFYLVKMIFRNEKLTGSESFIFTICANDTSELFESFLLQHYDANQNPPSEILLPIKLENKKSIEEIFSKNFKKSIKIKNPEKGKKKRFLDLALKNAKSISVTKQLKTLDSELLLSELQNSLSLNNFPKTIDCFDVSNTSQTDIVASKVTFINGKEEKTLKRLFIIKDPENIGDCPSLKEALFRYFSKLLKEKKELCDLLIVDGAKAQLNTAFKVLKELNIACVDVIAITKEDAKHDKGIREEKIFIKNESSPNIFDKISLDPHSHKLFLLQKIRDRAHDAAISFHKKRRSKRTISSKLSSIEGIGPVKQKILLKKFKSLENLKKASKKEILETEKITKKDVLKIFKFFEKN
jgi:excinuclease ABC subunit C